MVANHERLVEPATELGGEGGDAAGGHERPEAKGVEIEGQLVARLAPQQFIKKTKSVDSKQNKPGYAARLDSRIQGKLDLLLHPGAVPEVG